MLMYNLRFKFTLYKISIMQHLNDFYEERPLHSQKVTVWATLSSAGIIGPFFYKEDGKPQQLHRNVI